MNTVQRNLVRNTFSRPILRMSFCFPSFIHCLCFSLMRLAEYFNRIFVAINLQNATSLKLCFIISYEKDLSHTYSKDISANSALKTLESIKLNYRHVCCVSWQIDDCDVVFSWQPKGSVPHMRQVSIVNKKTSLRQRSLFALQALFFSLTTSVVETIWRKCLRNSIQTYCHISLHKNHDPC